MEFRVATFNVENLDITEEGREPTLERRIELMRPQLLRLRADIICFQEVHGRDGQLLALDKLLENTPYASFQRVSTEEQGQPARFRNIVTLCRDPILEKRQVLGDFISCPKYRQVTAEPPAGQVQEVCWERPLLYTRHCLGKQVLHLINLHLKSKRPVNIRGQKEDAFRWRSASGWAEGFFLSSMQRVGQAIEVRHLVDSIFDEDENARIIVCGDFNADHDEVPVQAIRGDVERTGNPDLSSRVLVPCEFTIPEPSRYSFLYQGKPEMLDHVLVSRSLLGDYRSTEIHNELLHDESLAFAIDAKFPESDHAPVVVTFYAN